MLTRCSAETSKLQVILHFPNTSQNADTLFSRDKHATFYISQIPVKILTEDHERRWSWSCMRRFFAARAELNPWPIFYIVFWVKTNNYE